jgi:hypothetical protein
MQGRKAKSDPPPPHRIEPIGAWAAPTAADSSNQYAALGPDDTGDYGRPPAPFDRVFERFQQLDRAIDGLASTVNTRELATKSDVQDTENRLIQRLDPIAKLVEGHAHQLAAHETALAILKDRQDRRNSP